MRVIDASKTGILVLGYQGESQRVMVRLPLVDERNGRNVAEEFPGGQFSLSVTFPNRPGEYIVSPSDYQVAGDWLEWVVKAAYTQFFGEGNLQINYSGFDSTGMTKSRVWRITNKKSISTGAGTVPDWSDWKTELLSAAAAVQSAVGSYDEMTATAEDGDQTSAHIDRTGDHPVLHIVIKNNGGGGGADIDDAHTRTDKTWSSKKISDELDTKADEEDLSSLSETIVQLAGTVSGKYAKPSGGIPASDMSEAVQTSLGKADTALQTHQDISGKQNKPSAAGTAGQVLGLDNSLNPVWKTPYPQNYELIADITLAEDTDDLVINKFSDNSQLLITDFILQCDFKAALSSSYLGAIWKDAKNVTQYMPTGQMLTDSDKTAYYWTERFGNMVRMFANRPYEWDATTYDQPYYYNMFYDSPTIREVNLYKYSDWSQPIPAGSRIRLWGVRA